MASKVLRIGVVLAICTTALMVGGTASASDVTATASILPGDLAMSATDAPSVSATLNGTDQQPSDAFDLSVNDRRGSGAGWKLQVTSTSFSTGGLTPRRLSTAASAITAATSACAQGTCTNPTNGISYPVTVPAGDLVPPLPAVFFNAAADTGLGDFTVKPTLRVSTPANAYAGTYTSVITVTVSSGPS